MARARGAVLKVFTDSGLIAACSLLPHTSSCRARVPQASDVIVGAEPGSHSAVLTSCVPRRQMLPSSAFKQDALLALASSCSHARCSVDYALACLGNASCVLPIPKKNELFLVTK